MRFFRLLTIATALSVGASYANAGPITGLFNTGVNAGGVAQLGGTNDTHYSVVSTPVGGGGPGLAIVVGPPTSPTFPIPPWAANTATYAWISGPNTVGNAPVIPTVNGEYHYQTTFTAVDTFQVNIAGNLTADDQVVRILINGAVATTTGLPTLDQGYANIYAFTAVGGGANIGLNTLTFVVNNTNAVVQGLQVSRITGFTLIPEPLSVVMLGSGLVGIAGIGGLRRMRKNAA